MSDVRINTRSPYYIEANPTAPEVPETPEVPDPPTNIPPTVTITASNTTPYVGDTITLTAVATDSDGTIVSYLWGGTSSPETTVSIDVTNTTVEPKIYNVAVTDDDGDVGLAQITINWQEVPEQITNTDIEVNCGDIINQASFVGTKTYNLVGVGDKVGEVEIEFMDGGSQQDSPVKFNINWNNTTNTTGYIGDSNYTITDPIPSPNNTAYPTNKKQPTTLTINKTAATPTEVVLTAEAFVPNDSFSFRLNCPDVEATETFYYTLTGTCTTGDTTFTYTDVNGVAQTVVLANGETQLASAQEDTVSAAICTGTAEKGGQSFDLGKPEQTVDTLTEFKFWLDNSGSLGYLGRSGEIDEIAKMTENELKNSFLQYYDNDTALYNERVIYEQNYNERFLNWATNDAISPTATKLVHLTFIDEAASSYHNSDVGDNTKTGAYTTDLSNFRNKLDSKTTFGEHLFIIFCIEKEKGGPPYDSWMQFSHFIDNISTGANGFDGSNGLSDRSEVIFVRNVLPAQNSAYYHQVTIDALQSLGYKI